MSPYWSQEGKIERRIPNDELLAEAKRLISEIEGQNPHLAQAEPSIAALEDQIRLWKQQCDQLQETLVLRENELRRVREDKEVFARKAEMLEARLKARRETASRRAEAFNRSFESAVRDAFNPYPNQPVEPVADQRDSRDWTNGQDGATEKWAFEVPEQTPDEDHWLTRFVDHPVTRFTAFATANIGFAVYLLFHH